MTFALCQSSKSASQPAGVRGRSNTLNWKALVSPMADKRLIGSIGSERTGWLVPWSTAVVTECGMPDLHGFFLSQDADCSQVDVTRYSQFSLGQQPAGRQALLLRTPATTHAQR